MDYKASYSLRMARNEEKRSLLLRFLRTEYYVSAENVADLFGVTAMPPVYRFLAKMEKDGFLSSAEFGELKKGRKLWGMTPHGVAFAFGDDEPLEDITPFQPSKVSPVSIPHHLDTQRLRIFAERKGMRWTSASTLLLKGVKAPDAVAITPTGKVFAIEVERTVKSPKRYREIVGSYLANMQKQGWDKVIFVLPDEPIKNRVQRIITSVDSVVMNGSTRKLEEVGGTKALSCFAFLTYAAFCVNQ